MSNKLTIEDIQITAQDRGGLCLSTSYINDHTKLQWQCNIGHIWYAQPNNIRHGQWCPLCSTGLRERICRTYFEQLFNTDFPKCRPKWLLNIRGNQMELDGFNKELNLAFEHNGRQHYVLDKQSKFKSMNLQKRIFDDQTKIKLCSEHDVTLISIPEIIKYTSISNLKDFIKNELIIAKRHDLIGDEYDSKKVNLLSAYIGEDIFRLQSMRDIAKNQNGELLDTEYFGTEYKYNWKCNICNYTWLANYDSIMRSGTWCPSCSNLVRPSLEKLNNFAKAKNGEFLGGTYKNCKSKLEWKCEKNHIWLACWSNILAGKWCPICKRKSHTIEEINETINNGCKCVSSIYRNNTDKLYWQCKNGHTWKASYANTRVRKFICPHCVKLSF